VLLYALGLMAKPMLVTVPIMLLLLDYWPLERLTVTGGMADTGNKASLRMLLMEKVPLAVMAAISAGVTLLAQRGAMASVDDVTVPARLTNAVVSCGRYLAGMVWPTNLAIHYLHPQKPPYLMAAVVMCMLAVVTWLAVRASVRKYLLTGWLWYLVTLIPVIGIVQVGNQSHADRYTYVPLVGIFIMLAFGAGDIVQWRPRLRPVLTVAGVAALLGLAAVTYRTIGFWKNDSTVYQRAVDISPKDAMMRASLAGALVSDGRYKEAEVLLRDTLKMDDRQAGGHSLMGVILVEQGRLDEAMDACGRAMALNPKLALTHYAMGNVYFRKRDFDKAVEEFAKAIELQPSSTYYGYLGNAYLMQQKWTEAQESYRKAIFMDPSKTEGYLNLAFVLAKEDRKSEAIAELKKLLAIDPKDGDALKLMEQLTGSMPMTQ